MRTSRGPAVCAGACPAGKAVLNVFITKEFERTEAPDCCERGSDACGQRQGPIERDWLFIGISSVTLALNALTQAAACFVLTNSGGVESETIV